MKVSIITPSYNQGQFLEETLLSVIGQDYKDVEYIVIDGGSTDDSVDIIKKYQNKIDYWVSEKDAGQADAINKGLKIATGEIVGWLNSDDYLEPNVLKDIVRVFEKDGNIGTVFGKIYIVNAKSQKIGERFNKKEITVKRLLNGGVQINQPGAFHRKSLLERYGFLDELLNYVMDYELWIRLGQYSKFYQIDRFAANHRLHAACKSEAEFIKFIPEIKKVRKKYGGRVLCRKTLDIFRIELGYWRRQLIGF
ncbi:glycosyltransferase [bacterium]|nr:glycosyltransferase [bacterium]